MRRRPRSLQKKADAVPHYRGIAHHVPAQRKKSAARVSYPAVVQRYKWVNRPEDNEKAQIPDQLLFESQGLDLDDENSYAPQYTRTSQKFNTGENKLIGTSTKIRTGIETEVENDAPVLKVSQNDQLAIHDVGQPKEFFATDEKVEESNGKLRSVGAEVGLKPEGGELTVPGGQHPLKRIVPVKMQNGIPGEERFMKTSSYQCNDVMNTLLDTKNFVLVLARQHENDVITEDFIGKRGNKETTVRNYLGSEKMGVTRTGLKKAIRSGKAGKGNYPGLNDETKRFQGEKLGLNENAFPDVGEAFLISSQPSQELNVANQTDFGVGQLPGIIQELEHLQENIEYSRQNISVQAMTLMKTWGTHYASVVARDGADSVTLENFNRGPEDLWRTVAVFTRLFKNFEEFRTLVESKVTELDIHRRTRTAVKLIREAIAQLNDGEKQLSVQYQNALAEAAVLFGENEEQGVRETEALYEMLFFQMYGPQEQSFHRTYLPMTTNPLTFRMRPSESSVDDIRMSKMASLDEVSTRVHSIVSEAKFETAPSLNFTSLLPEIVLTQLPKLRALCENTTSLEELKSLKTAFSTASSDFQQLILQNSVYMLRELVPFGSKVPQDLNTLETTLAKLNALYADPKEENMQKCMDLELKSYEQIDETARQDLVELAKVVTRLRIAFSHL